MVSQTNINPELLCQCHKLIYIIITAAGIRIYPLDDKEGKQVPSTY